MLYPAHAYTSQAGGHVAFLASTSTEFRGRPPTRRGADVRYAVTVVLQSNANVIQLLFTTLPIY